MKPSNETDTIDMVDVRARLLDVSLADDVDDVVKRFCRFLSPRVKDGMSPHDFVYMCNYTIDDLMAGQVPIAFVVDTLEGTFTGKPGDWLAEGIDGERYIIDNAIFKKTYEPVGV